MKSYIQGILTGGFIVFTLMVILGHKDYDSRYSQEIGGIPTILILLRIQKT